MESVTCGQYAAALNPRLGMSFACVLPQGHDGDHRAGGECFAHGPYVMERFGEVPKCPKWPVCEAHILQGANNPFLRYEFSLAPSAEKG